jgi:hypothetical protein
MMRQEIIYNDVSYYWSASQDSEHPDMTVYRSDHEIYIQVEVKKRKEKKRFPFHRQQRMKSSRL